MCGVGAIIVTYNPGKELIVTIKQLIISEAFVVIVDNCSISSPIFKTIVSLSKQHPHQVIIKQNTENLGLAAGQNQGLEVLKFLKLDYALLLDQDTIISSQLVNCMKNTFISLKNSSYPDLGVLVPNYINKQTKQMGKFTQRVNEKFYKFSFKDQSDDKLNSLKKIDNLNNDLLDSHSSSELTDILTTADFVNNLNKHKQLISHINYKEIAFANASGMFFELTLIEKIGELRADFFIDQIDVEFCQRLFINDYKLIVLDIPLLNHAVGEGMTKKFGKHTLCVSKHNEVRRYYTARNAFYMKRIYKQDRAFKQLINYRLIYNMITILFFEKQKLKKLFYFMRGILDGCKYSRKTIK